MNKQGRTLTYNGITDTIHGWARRMGVSDVTIRRRLASGYSDERALTEPMLPARGGRPKLYEYKGESKTLTQWGKQYGVSEATIRRRLKDGWTMEEALNTPPSTHQQWGGNVTRRNESPGDVSISDIIDMLDK